MRAPLSVLVVGAAAILTIANAAKPYNIDDTLCYDFVERVAAHPFDPYGFFVEWTDAPTPAFDQPFPLALPYWLAPAMFVSGGDPTVVRLWQFLPCLLFVAALAGLYRRFARGLESPLLILTAFSPAFALSLNLMLDIPALSLGLAAIVFYVRAAEHGDRRLAIGAGLLLGLAVQTKYNMLLLPGVLLAHLAAGVLRPDSRRPVSVEVRSFVLAMCAAVVMFAALELPVLLKYGESHLLHTLGRKNEFDLFRQNLSAALFTLNGAVGTPLLLLGLVALGFGAMAILTIGGVLAGGYLLLAALPTLQRHFPAVFRDSIGEHHVFGLFGVVLAVILVAVAVRALFDRASVTEGSGETAERGDRDDVFLILWLALEVAGYFTISIFPAVRRVLGILIAGSLLAGRLAARRGGVEARRFLVRAVAAGSVVLGTGFFALDFLDAAAQRDAVHQAVARIGTPAAGSTVWYVGHWGVQFYAKRAGMEALMPGSSRMRPGDWLLVPDFSIDQQAVRLDPKLLEEVGPAVEIHDPWPLRASPNFYGGMIPLAARTGPRFQLKIYLAREDFLAVAPSS